MTCLLKDFLQQFALEPGDMLLKLLDSKKLDIHHAAELKSKTNALQSKSFDLNALLLFWGSLAQNNEEEISQDIVYHALLFQAAHINDPESQACFSAIELYKLLKHLDNLQIYLQTLEDSNHQIVVIHAHDAHYVYDPIKDPHLLFTEEEYQVTPRLKTFLIRQSLILAYESLQEKFITFLALDTRSPSFKKENNISRLQQA